MIEGGITPLHSYEELKAMGFQVRGGTDRWRTAQLLFGVVSRALGRQSLMMISPPVTHQPSDHHPPNVKYLCRHQGARVSVRHAGQEGHDAGGHGRHHGHDVSEATWMHVLGDYGVPV